MAERKNRVVTITLDPSVLEFIDAFGKENGISRSGAISVLANTYRQNTYGLKVLGDLVTLVNSGATEEEIVKKEKELSEFK